jgi:hypothetical protein
MVKRIVNPDLPIMNSLSKSRPRVRWLWPVIGFLIGISAAIIPKKVGITLEAGVAVWCLEMVLVLILGANCVGARIGVLITGLCLAVPCFVGAPPFMRFLLAGFIGVPFAAAVALWLAPPMIGVRSRLAFLCAWSDTYPLERRARSVNVAALRNLILGTVVFAAALAAVKAASDAGLAPLRWFAGGIAVLAMAEMGTAAHNFLPALLGLTVPPLFQSPHRSKSVGEFWARRWDVPAGEAFRRFCFAPLARRGAIFAMTATFMISAAGHALLVFLALGRWRPALICGAFFLVQPVLIAAERQLNVRRWRAASAWLWTLGILTLTSPLFVEPILQIVEGLWSAPKALLPPVLAMVGFVIGLSGTVSLASLSVRPPQAKGTV